MKPAYEVVKGFSEVDDTRFDFIYLVSSGQYLGYIEEKLYGWSIKPCDEKITPRSFKTFEQTKGAIDSWMHPTS